MVRLNMHYIVSYDVVKTKARTKLSKLLLDYCHRVQYSVFECDLTSQRLKTLMEKAEKIIDPEEDQIRVYAVCETCRNLIQTKGKPYSWIGYKETITI